MHKDLNIYTNINKILTSKLLKFELSSQYLETLKSSCK